MTDSASPDTAPDPKSNNDEHSPVGDQAKENNGGLGGQIAVLRPKPSAETDRACARFPLTDLGNAERFVRRYGDDFRFCAELGWFRWDGRRWELLSEEKDRLPALVLQSVFLTVRAIKNEAMLVRESGVRNAGDGEGGTEPDSLAMDHVIDAKKGIKYSDKIVEWARTSEGAGRLGCIAVLAKAFARIAVNVEDFDIDRMAINCLNGTLRIERASRKREPAEIASGKSEWHSIWVAKLHKHARSDLLTKVARVAYRPKAKAAVYDAFFEQMQPDPIMRRFIMQWGGYSMCGDTSEQKLAFFYGTGSNGKGTWVELVAHVAGDYAGSLKIESLLATKTVDAEKPSPSIARLPGIRFLRVSEPSKGGVLNEGFVKLVTGEDPLDARHLNRGMFTFFPDFKMTISGNNKPVIKDASDGIWRRMQLVPWGVKIPNDQKDNTLKKRMLDDAEGVFARLIEGLLDWRQNGLIEPDAVRMATSKYRDDSDDLGKFLRQCCEMGVDTRDRQWRTPIMTLFKLYEAWAVISGGFAYTNRQFKKAMEDKGFEQKHANGDFWLGVKAMVEIYDIQNQTWTALDGNEAGGPALIKGGTVADDSDLDGLPI